MNKKQIIVIGGGAAGFFGAISAAENNPEAKVILLEKNRTVLNKVRISGGGRCNVTHACFDNKQLQNFTQEEEHSCGHYSINSTFKIQFNGLKIKELN